MWQFVCGITVPGWSLGARGYNIPLKDYTPYSINWVWGSQVRYNSIPDCLTLRLIVTLGLGARIR